MFLMIDGSSGIYIPKLFAERGYPIIWDGISEEAREILRKGPEAEHYWDAWDEVLETAIVEDQDGARWRLYQDEGLFARKEEK